MTVDETLALTKALMTGRKDWQGRDYFHHDTEVMELLGATASETEKKAALLHSVLDQKAARPEDLERLGVEPEVIELVRLVSNGPHVTSYAAYVQKCREIVASGNKSAMCIKLADMLANEGHPTNNYRETIAIMRDGIART